MGKKQVGMMRMMVMAMAILGHSSYFAYRGYLYEVRGCREKAVRFPFCGLLVMLVQLNCSDLLGILSILNAVAARGQSVSFLFMLMIQFFLTLSMLKA